MSDRKTLAIALGTAAGIAAAATVIGLYCAKNCDNAESGNVNDVFERAKQTVKKLDDAIDMLRKSASA